MRSHREDAAESGLEALRGNGIDNLGVTAESGSLVIDKTGWPALRFRRACAPVHPLSARIGPSLSFRATITVVSVAILTKPGSVKRHQVRKASGWARKDPDRIDPGSTIGAFF
jgi:hypothetical protein